MSRFIGRVATLLLLLCLSVSPALAQFGPRVAKMVAIDGRSTDYVVRRQGRPVPVTFNMALLFGDEIEVRAPKRSMKILYVEGGDDTITMANSPFRLKLRAQVTNPMSNYRRELWKNVTKAHDDGLGTHAIRDRDKLALDMPGLNDGTARIAAGDRHFMLEWTGGPGPYHVIVRNARKEAVVDEDGLPTRQLVISSRTIRFDPGAYTVEVATRTQRVLGGFEAVATGSPAAEPLASDPEGAVEAAEKLAEQGDRTLLYEAYLRLYAGIRARSGLAQALGDYLAVGAPSR